MSDQIEITEKNAGDILKEIEDEAVSRYLNKMDFDARDYMTEAEQIRHKKAYMIEFGTCPDCGYDTENDQCEQ